MKGAFLPLKFYFENTLLQIAMLTGVIRTFLHNLIDDVAYSIRPWFYSQFKGNKDGLSKEKVF